MRKLYFLVPGTTGKFGGGGLWAELKTFHLAQKICEAAIVTYRQRESNHLFLADLLQNQGNREGILIVSWGFDVPRLVKQLQGCAVVYHAHSTGYGFRLPSSVPIITVSRNTMGYWGEKSPNALIYYLPNHISEEFRPLGIERDIDVLVQARKSSDYLLKQLVPRLRQRCRVQLLEGYVEDLAHLFNRSKVYLYDSAQYWAVTGLTEGFGLPPLEALACGCQVFSSVNHALSDYLDPSFNCHKIGAYSLAYDLDRILASVQGFSDYQFSESFLAPYREEQLLHRLEQILREINQFFDVKARYSPDIDGLGHWRVRQLWLGKTVSKIRQKIGLGKAK